MEPGVFKHFFVRDLRKLASELEAYKDEAAIWQTSGAIANAAGNLCLHLVGNLNTFIGKELGGTDYVRHRDLEFSRKDVSCEELLVQIANTLHVVEQTLDNLSPAKLDEPYPATVFEQPMTTGYFLLHLLSHLGYHLGQINYHRRLLDPSKPSVSGA